MSLLEAVNRYTTNFNNHLQLPSDNLGHLLSIHNGNWNSRPALIPLGVVQDDTDLDQFKNTLLDKRYPILDMRDYTLWVFVGDTWVSESVSHESLIDENLLAKDWLVVSPYNNKFYYSTATELQELYRNTVVDGFHGEVPTTELITGNALASLIGLTDGEVFHSTEPWLHFTLDGKILYVAKKPYRWEISWDILSAVNAVNGSRIITVAGNPYKIRLLKGANADPIGEPTSRFNPESAWGSEWNRLMYRIAAGNPDDVFDSGEPHGDWAQYTDEDLILTSNFGNGYNTWCQEAGPNGSTYVQRGGEGVTWLSESLSWNAGSANAWRPVLELVE